MPRTKRTKTRHHGVYAIETAAGGLRYDAVYTDHAGARRSRSFPRLADANTWRMTVLADVARGLDAPTADARRLTVDHVAAAWLAGGTWRPSTLDTLTRLNRVHVRPTFGRRLVGSVRPSDVRAWLARMIDAGDAPASIAARRGVLTAIMATAVADRIIPANPCTGVRAPKDPRTPADRAAALTPGQLAALVDALPDRLGPFALTVAYTGLRPSEAAGLTVDRVDFLRHRVTVDRQLVATVGGLPVFGPPKTTASVRTVPLPDALAEALAAHLAARPAGPSGLIFTTARGTPLLRGPRSHAWRDASDRVEGLPPAVRGWHALRHTFASVHLAAGTDLATVARLLGHATISETAQTYAHMLTGRDDAARNVAADALSPPEPMGNVREQS